MALLVGGVGVHDLLQLVFGIDAPCILDYAVIGLASWPISMFLCIIGANQMAVRRL
jgi:hypothetical protein